MAPEKTFGLLKYEHIIYSFEAHDLESLNNYFCKIYKFSDFMNTLKNFLKSIFAHISMKLKYFTIYTN